MRFDIHFKLGKHDQWIEFVIERPLDDEYWKRHNAWAAYTSIGDRHKRKGKFGIIELPLMEDNALFRGSLQHEVDHFVIDLFLCWSGGKITRRNEEKFATIAGEIVTEFWEIYGKDT